MRIIAPSCAAAEIAMSLSRGRVRELGGAGRSEECEAAEAARRTRRLRGGVGRQVSNSLLGTARAARRSSLGAVLLLAPLVASLLPYKLASIDPWAGALLASLALTMPKAEDELAKAHAGTHPRVQAEEKRLLALKQERLKRAQALRQSRLAVVDKELAAEQQTAQDEFAREKSSLQIALQEQVIERQRRTSKVEAPELRAVTRQMRTMRGQTAAAPKAAGKRDAKGALSGATPPLRQGEVEEDFEEMQQLAQRLAPHLDIDLDIDVQPHKRLRPVEAVRPTARMEASASQGRSGRGRRADFDFKGKSRLEVANARITVWYEEEHYGRKTDVPYVGVVKSCDPREGLYVQFENYDGEMLITNEDDWRWVRRATPRALAPARPPRVR